MEFRVRRRCWLSVISTASFFRMRLHGRRVRFEALQPPRVRYPIWWQGELLPPDQMAGGRARNRDAGWSSSVRIVSRVETIRPRASVPAPRLVISLRSWLTTRPARHISRIALFRLWGSPAPPSGIGAEQCERQLRRDQFSSLGELVTTPNRSGVPLWPNSCIGNGSCADRRNNGEWRRRLADRQEPVFRGLRLCPAVASLRPFLIRVQRLSVEHPNQALPSEL